jgi:hypothetical protein
MDSTEKQHMNKHKKVINESGIRNHKYTSFTHTDNNGQQNLTFFLFHEKKYLIPIELLTLNSNM